MANLQLWNDLAVLEPQSTAERTMAGIQTGGGYQIAILNRIFSIAAVSRTICRTDLVPAGNHDHRLEPPLLKYMTDAEAVDPSGEWVSPRDLPGGAQFFTGVHAIPVGKIIATFGENRELFATACTMLGGEPVPFGDAGFLLRLFPRLHVQVLLWLCDDEFPARASMLVDRNASRHLPLDALLLALGYLQYSIVSAR